VIGAALFGGAIGGALGAAAERFAKASAGLTMLVHPVSADSP